MDSLNETEQEMYVALAVATVLRGVLPRFRVLDLQGQRQVLASHASLSYSVLDFLTHQITNIRDNASSMVSERDEAVNVCCTRGHRDASCHIPSRRGA